MASISGSDEEDSRGSSDEVEVESASVVTGYSGKVNVLLQTHTIEQFPNSDFIDMYVTQAFTKNLIGCVHASWIQIIFFNSKTFRVPSLRRDLVAMVPRMKYNIIQRNLQGSNVGDVWYDNDRFYACVDNSTSTVYRQDVIVKSVLQSERYIRKNFSLSKGPEGERIHFFYVSNGDHKWLVKTFSELTHRRLCLTNVILSTKPTNFYHNLDPVGKYKTSKGVERGKPVIPRGELAPYDKYSQVSGMRKINEVPAEGKPQPRIDDAEIESLVEQRYQQRKADLEKEFTAKMEAFFQEQMRTGAFESPSLTCSLVEFHLLLWRNDLNDLNDFIEE